MAVKTVTWSSLTKLSCADCVPAEVVLCIKPDLIAQKNCPIQPVEAPEDTEKTTFLWHSIDATLISVKTTTNTCARTTYEYMFSFEDEQLIELAILNCVDIFGVFCRGCFSDYIDDKAGNEIYLRLNEDETYTLFSQHGCEFTFSTGVGADLAVEDTESVDLSITAGPGQTLSADVNISEDVGNIIEIRADGLFAEAEAGPGGDDWHILGNAGTVDGTNFIGTTDDIAHDVRVNNTRVRRSVPDVTCNIIIDGDATNSAVGSGCTIGGGGDSGFGPNDITEGFFSTVGGGANNQIHNDQYDPIEIGYDNGFSTIGGGFQNLIQGVEFPGLDTADPGGCTIGGGKFHTIQGCVNATIGGGYINLIQYDLDSTDDYVMEDTIAGGDVNQIYGVAGDGPSPGVLGQNFIGGGETNEIDNGMANVISGGKDNFIGFQDSDISRGPNSYNMIVGGFENEMRDCARVVMGGGLNTVQGNDSSAILSGYLNRIEATANVPVVPYGVAGSSFKPPDTDGVGNVIIGGEANRILDGRCSTILGGAFLQIGQNSFGFQSAETRDFTEIAGGSGGHPGRDEPVQVDVSAFPGIGYVGDVDLWIGNTDSVARALKLFCPNADLDYSTSNFSSLEAQTQAGGSIRYILPDTLPSIGDSLKVANVAGNVVTLEWSV